MRQNANSKGFTLIELLIVIGIIGFLAAAVLVAVDPVKRIQDSRDARRYSEVNTILNAVLTKQVDDRAVYVGDSAAPIISSATRAQVIVRDSSAVTCNVPASAPTCPQLPSGYSLDTTGANKNCVAQLKSTQLTAPGLATAGVPTVGGNLTALATYSYKVTFVSANGETELGTVSATQTTTAPNRTIGLSAIPLGATGTTARKIYRTVGNNAATGPWLYLTTIADNTTTVYSDILADAALGSAGPSTNSTGGLVPNYAADIPVDPSTSVAVTGLPLGPSNSGYYLIRNSAGRVTIGACYGEQNTAITVQR